MLEPYPASRTIIVDLLSRWQAQPVICEDEAEAEAVLREQHIDAVMVDQAAVDTIHNTVSQLGLDLRIVMITYPGQRNGNPDATITRPVRQSAIAHALAPKQASTPTNTDTHDTATGHGLKVLVAEDNRINQMVAARALTRLGCTVEVVHNGREAVTAVSQSHYDLVLMDVQMPEMDGLEATRTIRNMADVVQPLVVALTANAMQEDRNRCLAAGMDDFLAKPITLEGLVKTINRVTPTSKLTRTG